MGSLRSWYVGFKILGILIILIVVLAGTGVSCYGIDATEDGQVMVSGIEGGH